MSKTLTDADFEVLSDKDFLTDEDFASEEGPGFWESAIRGVGRAGNTAMGGLDMAAAGLAGLMGDKEGQEKIFNEMKSRDQFWNSKEMTPTTTMGKLGAAVGAIPQFLNPITAGLQIAGSGSERGRSHIDDGGSLGGALAAQGIDTGLGVAGVAIPGQLVAGRMRNAGATAGANVAQEEVSHGMQQGIRGIEDIKQLPERDMGDRLASAIPGAVMGAAIAKPRTTTETPPETKPTKTLPPSQTEVEADIIRRSDFRIEKDSMQLAELESTKASMEANLARIQDRIAQNGGAALPKELESIDRIESALNGVNAKIKTVSESLGEAASIRSKYDTPPKTEDPLKRVNEIVSRLKDPKITGDEAGKLQIESENLIQELLDVDSRAFREGTDDNGALMAARSMRDVAKRAQHIATRLSKETSTEKPAVGASKLPLPEPDTAFSKELDDFDTAVNTVVSTLRTERENTPPPIDSKGKMGKQRGAIMFPFGPKTKVVQNIPGGKQAVTYKPDINKPLDLKTIKDNFMNGNWKDLDVSMLRNAAKEYFGDMQFIQQLGNRAPLVTEAYNYIDIATRTAIKQSRAWLEDYDSTKVFAKGLGPLRKLTQYKNPDSVNALWHEGTWQDVSKVKQSFEDAFKNDISLADWYNQNHTQLSPIQQKMFKSANKMWDKMFLDTGMDPGKNYRRGWFYAGRKGDYGIIVKDVKDTPIHIEFFRTTAEAEIFQKQLANHNPDFKAESYDRDANPSLFDQLDAVAQLFGEKQTPEQQAAVKTIEEARQRVAFNAGLGSHQKHRLGLTGYEGSRWFKTEKENAEAFRQAVFDSAGEYSSLYKKRLLSQISEGFVRDPDLQEKAPNQVELARHLFDNAMNEMDNYGTFKSPSGEKVNSEKVFKNWFDSKVVNGIDSINKRFGTDLPMPKHSILDKGHGLAAQMFYISALTTRPAFWAGQVLTAPFALRGLLREGRPIDTMVASGKGMWNVLTGGDAQFREFIKRVANETDSLHPQFMNDINSIGKQWLDSGKHATVKGIIEWGTGQAPGALADSISRYITMSIGYEFYKPLLKNPQALVRQVANFSDATMVMYGRQHVSPMIQKMGTVGEFVAPLTKYPTAQLGNLIADLTLIKDNPTNIKAVLPALSTLLTSMMMGGTMGTVLVAEYEMLRAAIAWLVGPDNEDMLPPSMERGMMENTNLMQRAFATMYNKAGMDEDKAIEAAQLGLVSAVAGYDVGSGLRFQGFTPDSITGEGKGLWSMIPVVGFFKDLLPGIGTQLAHTLDRGTVTDAEVRKADLSFQPVVGTKAIIDRFKHDADTRDYVPDTTRGFAEVPQTPREEVATLLGTRTNETALTSKRLWLEKKDLAKKTKLFEKHVDIAFDRIEDGASFDVKKLIQEGIAIGKTPDVILESFVNIAKSRNIPHSVRFQVGTDGSISLEEMIKIMKYNKVEGLDSDTSANAP